MKVVVRRLRLHETRAYLEVHRAAVHGTASNDYPDEVVRAWAPLPVTEAAVAAAQSNPDGEVRLAAEAGGRIIGIGTVVPKLAELRACYVLPEAGGKGVGKALVSELERIARCDGAAFLTLQSSLTALPFYRALGYDIVERTEHVLSSGVSMAAVTMRKAL